MTHPQNVYPVEGDRPEPDPVIVDPWAIPEELTEGDIDLGDGRIVGPEERDEDDEPDPEAAAEDPAEAEDGADPEEAEGDEQEAAPVFDVEQWNGNLDELPDNVPREVFEKIHKFMERGAQIKYRQLAALRKEYEQKLESANQPGVRENTVAEGPPPMPGENATQAEWQAWHQKTVEFHAKQTAERIVQERLPDISGLQEKTAQFEMDRRLSMLTQQDGYTPEVDKKMADLATSSEFWMNALRGSDEQALQLFSFARSEVERESLRRQVAEQDKTVAKAEAEEVKRKTSAAERAVSRSGSSKKATPADRYSGKFSLFDGESMSELDRRILADLEGG